ncbi:acyl-CoA thioesterase [Virgibacillus sp. FSP13]
MTASHEVDVYVRFSETDAAGHVNNTSHFLYLEEARTKFFKVVGIGEEPTHSYLNFILASTTCDYVAQAFAGQTLKIATYVAEIGTKSFRLDQVITNADSDAVVAEASATLVCFNYVEQKTEPIPLSLRENLETNMANHAI